MGEDSRDASADYDAEYSDEDSEASFSYSVAIDGHARIEGLASLVEASSPPKSAAQPQVPASKVKGDKKKDATAKNKDKEKEDVPGDEQSGKTKDKKVKD